MHPEARQWVARWATTDACSVLEVGSLNVNGHVRDLFPNAAYTGLNDVDGIGVDIVADAAHWTPNRLYDVVVCCEVLEHAREWPQILATCGAALRAGGQLIVTCAGPGRAPHGQHGAPLPIEGEWYANVTVDEVLDACPWGDGTAQKAGEDTQAVIVKR